MNYYPLIETSDLSGFVTLANFPPTERWKKTEAFVYAAQLIQGKWHITPLGILAPGETRRYTRKSGNFCDSSSIFFFMSPESTLSLQIDELPLPTQYQTATPRWRATLGVSMNGGDAAYSGEYPDEMLKLEKSSCISLCPLIQLSKNIQTTIVFINMLRKPLNQEYSAQLIDCQTKDTIQKWNIRSNKVNICEISPELFKDVKNALTSFVVNGITGIPVYVSKDIESGFLSFEHSHPPIEFLVFGGARTRQEIVRNIKKEWV